LKQYDNFVNILRPSSREKLDKVSAVHRKWLYYLWFLIIRE
jgi:hypothetical protein